LVYLVYFLRQQEEVPETSQKKKKRIGRALDPEKTSESDSMIFFSLTGYEIDEKLTRFSFPH